MEPTGIYGLASAFLITWTIRHRKSPNCQGKCNCKNYDYDGTHSTVTMEKFDALMIEI